MTAELKETARQELQPQEGTEYTKNRKVFIPRADIYESPDAITVLADMPGVNQSGVDITLEKNRLTITGTVEPPQKTGYTLSYSEYQHGDFRRVFELPNEVDRNGIDALIKNGVLRLTLPKSKEAQSKKISVKGN